MTFKNRYFISSLILLLFSLWSAVFFGQGQKIDSLKSRVALEKKDTAMTQTLNALSVALLNNENITESLVYSEKAYKLADKINDKKGKAYALKNMGLAEYYQGNFMLVLDYWSRSMETFKILRDTIGIANMSNNLGAVYYSQGSHAKALDFYLESLSLAEKIKDTLRIISVLPNIGAIYGDMLNYDNALKYFNQMEQYLQRINNKQVTSYYLMGVGEVYRKREELDMALKFYKQALPINKSTNAYAHNLTMIGIVEFEKGNVEKSKEYLNRAYQIAQEKSQTWERVEALIPLGKVYQKSDFSKALSIYSEAEELSISMKISDGLVRIYEGMSQTYAAKGDFKSALKYHKKFLIQKDSLFNIETNDKIRGLQFDFDLEKKEDQIGLLEKEAEIQQLNEKRQKIVIYASIIALVLIFLLTIGLYKRYKFVNKTNLIIEEEKNRSENLLLNILPEETAQELKLNGKVQAKKFESVTVLFTDFKGFTDYAHNLSPEELVNSVDYYFSKFDEIMDKYGMEKIKTIGDAYMCAGGLPFPSEGHPIKMIDAAFEITEFIEKSKKLNNRDITHFDVRVGINTGPVVAGVVGIKKFAYDIWGDTVNVASRMETKSETGRINISENTYKLVRDEFDCEYRGEIDVKNRGMMKMYFVNARKKKPKKQIVENQKNII